MTDKNLDPNLQAPQEANTTKHINFREAEERAGNATGDEQENFRDDDSPTRKEWEELRKELKEDDSTKE